MVFITGSGRGIGSGIALAFAERGYDIVLHDRQTHEGLDAIEQQVRQSGRRVSVLIGDLMDKDVPAQLVDDAFAQMGRLDVVVNNAGITIFQPFQTTTFDQLTRVYQTDFLAPYLCAQRAAQVMIQNGTKGSIVNIASVHHERANDGDSVYGPMKAALVRATESMAYELAPYGIRVNAVSPGLTLRAEPTGEYAKRVEQVEACIPLRRAGRVFDVAKAVAWLASDEAEYITGANLRVDGGMNLPLTRALVDGRQVFF